MKSEKEQNVEYNLVKKWKAQIPEIEKLHDLRKAVGDIKKDITESVNKTLSRKGFNFKQTSSIGNVLGKSIVKMVEQMVQEIDLGEMK